MICANLITGYWSLLFLSWMDSNTWPIFGSWGATLHLQLTPVVVLCPLPLLYWSALLCSTFYELHSLHSLILGLIMKCCFTVPCSRKYSNLMSTILTMRASKIVVCLHASSRLGWTDWAHSHLCKLLDCLAYSGTWVLNPNFMKTLTTLSSSYHLKNVSNWRVELRPGSSALNTYYLPTMVEISSTFLFPSQTTYSSLILLPF